MVNKKEKEFLQNSNWIENEYSDIAMKDSIKAWNFAKKNKQNITIDYIREIHKNLMIRLNPEIAGQIRTCRIYVGGSSGYKECLKPKYVMKKLEEWIKLYSKQKKDYEIKKAHVLFENIHPFKDGNGRIGRILMNVQRLNAELPLLVIYEKEKQEYYKWFEQNTNIKSRGFKDSLLDSLAYGELKWKRK